MFDHIGITVGDLQRSRAFYTEALEPLGIRELMQFDDAVAFGRERPMFWLSLGERTTPGTRTHVAFVASTRLDVEAFHRAALAAGGVDNGAPGLRPHYHANYYGAFVLDPDGNNVEAVCRRSA
jgi:catechol 2,3-dioxygenase-like lactoylglutathione lyase family enzyme